MRSRMLAVTKKELRRREKRYADICVARANASVPDTEGVLCKQKGCFCEVVLQWWFERRWSLVHRLSRASQSSRFQGPSQSQSMADQPHRRLGF